MDAIILAAGRGSRLGNLTREVPKPLTLLAGKSLVEWQINALQVAGIQKINLVTGYAGDKLTQEIIGIRPGEKLHEVMCPSDDSYHTFEFDDFFIIGPTINFNNRNNDFSVTAVGEKGLMVEQGFEYNSRNNSDFLTVAQLKELNDKVVME